MAYSIRLPDGTLVQNIPDEVTPEAAKAKLLQARPDLAPKDRTWGEAASDIGASAVSGLGSLVQLPGQLYGLATGDFSKTGALGLGEDIQKQGEEMKSAGLKAREAQRAAKMAEAEKKGQLSAFGTAISETIKDPALLAGFISENIPQLIPALLTGGGTSALTAAGFSAKEAAKLVGSGMAKEAAELAAKKTGAEAAVKLGTKAAIGTGAVQQGADIGAQTYEDAYKRLLEQGVDPTAAAGSAINQARAAGASAAVISLLAQRLPGAQTLEHALAGGKGTAGMAKGFLRGVTGEGLSEGVEEGGGQLSRNIALRDIDPTQSLTEGIGQAAGMGVVGGIGLGGGAGALSGFRGEAPATTQQPGAVPPSEEALQQERLRRAAEQKRVEQGRMAREGESLLDAEAKAQAKEQRTQMQELEKQAADEIAAARAQREAELREAFPDDYSDVMAGTNAYMDLFNEKQSLLQQRQTKDIKARIKQVDARMTEIVEADTRVAREVKRIQDENAKATKQLPAELKARYAGLAFDRTTPQQMEMRAATVEQTPVEQTDLFGNPLTPATEPAPRPGDLYGGVPLTTENITDAGMAMTPKELEAAGQMRLPMGRAKPLGQISTPTQTEQTEEKVQATEQPVPEPTVRQKPTPQTVGTVVDDNVLATLGIGRTAILRRAGHEIQGLDISKPADAARVKEMLEIYKEGRSPSIVEKVDAYLARPEFQGAENVTTTPTEAPVAVSGTEPRAGEPSMGVPVEPASAEPVGARAAEPTDTTGTAAPVERGLVPAGQSVEQRNAVEGARNAPVTGGMFDQLVKGTEEQVDPVVADLAAKEASGESKPKNPFDWKNWKSELAPSEEPSAEDQQTQKQAVQRARRLEQRNKPKTVGTVKTKVEAKIRERILAGDVRGALQAILDDKSGVYNDLDRAVARRILLSNKLPTIKTVADGALGYDEKGRPIAGQYDAKGDQVLLADSYAGAHALLHELVHGFVHRAIAMHLGGKINNAGVRNLQKLYEFVAKSDPSLLKEYGMTNLSEFASEAMSNFEFQARLNRIPFRRQNAFTAFAQAVLRVLGLSPTDQHTALAAAMLSVDSIMTEGRKLQEQLTGTDVEGALPSIANMALDPAALAAIQQVQDALPVEERGSKGFVGQAMAGIQNAREKSGILQTFRQAVADKFASVEAKVSQYFSKGVRDSFGNLNPMVLVRQAEDSAKLAMDFFRSGGIRFNKDGLVETYTTDASMVSALNKVQDFAKENGLSFEEAKSKVSTLLEAHRLYDTQKNHNEPLEQSALLLEKQGKNKEADAERAKKIDLHMGLAEIEALEKIYQGSASVQAIQNDLNATRTQAIELAVQAGRLTKEQGKFWKDNAAYVPFNRVMEEIATGPKFLSGKGLAVLRNIPQFKGSLGRPVHNVLDAYANRLSYLVEESLKNNASLKLLETMEMAGLAAELKHPDHASNRNLVVPRIFRNGAATHFEVQNEYDLLAFQQAPEVMNWFTKSLGATARILRLSVTAMPPFAIKQVIEDAQRAMMYSGVERPLIVGMKAVANMPRVFFGELTGRKSPAVKRMEELGIIGDYDFNIYRPVEDIEKEIGAKKRGAVDTVFHTLEKFTKASDLAARLAVYEETMRETNGDELLAQTRARELINFSRRGSSQTMRTAARVIPFFNAYAQGMDVLYRTASGMNSPSAREQAVARKLFWSRVAMMTSLGFAYALAMADDDGYENATDEVRDNNWLLPNGYKLPVPKELGFIYKSIPERIVQYYKRSGTPEEQSVIDALGGVVKGAMSAYSSPTAVPQTIKPLLENMTNYSFFLQRELESASLQRKEPGQRFTSSTSELAKQLGEATNISPIKIDNVMRGMFGMAGSTALLVTDALLNPTRPDRPLYQMPLTNIFLYDQIGGRKKGEFYDLSEKVLQRVNTYNDLKERDPEKAEVYAEKNAEYLAAAPVINRTLKELSDIRKMRKVLEQGSDEMVGVSGEERRQMIDELRQLENETVAYAREYDTMLRGE